MVVNIKVKLTQLEDELMDIQLRATYGQSKPGDTKRALQIQKEINRLKINTDEKTNKKNPN